MSVCGLQAVGSCINYLTSDPSTTLPALNQVYMAARGTEPSSACDAHTHTHTHNVERVLTQSVCVQLLHCPSPQQKNEDPALRLTMLQALHDTIQAAGGRMSDKHKTEILATLLALFSTAQVCNGVYTSSFPGM